MIERIVRLPLGFRATFRFDERGNQFAVDWKPSVPKSAGSARHARRFMAAYRRARDDFLTDVSSQIGGNIMVYDVGDGGTTNIKAPAIH
jgi:hypothetical protein